MVSVKILGVSGTFVKGGNCDIAVQEALKTAAKLGDVETDFVTLADKEIAPCKHCQWCIEHRSLCKVNDDANGILKMMADADGIIFGAPTWCRTMAPPLLNLFSRARSTTFFFQTLRNKVGGFISLGFLDFGLENCLEVMENLVYGHGVIPVARATALASGVALGRRPDYLEHGVLDDPRGMVFIQGVGERVVEVARMVKYATQNGVVAAEPISLSTGTHLKPKKKVFVDGVWRDKEDKGKASA